MIKTGFLLLHFLTQAVACVDFIAAMMSFQLKEEGGPSNHSSGW